MTRSSAQFLSFFTKFGEMTNAEKGNKSTTFWDRSSGQPDPDESANPNLNPGLLLVEATTVQEVSIRALSNGAGICAL